VDQLYREIFVQSSLGDALAHRAREIDWDKSVFGLERSLSPRGRTDYLLNLEDVLDLLTPWYVVGNGAGGLVASLLKAVILLDVNKYGKTIRYYGSEEDVSVLVAEFMSVLIPISRKIEILHEVVTHWSESGYERVFIEHLKWIDSVVAQAQSMYEAER